MTGITELRIAPQHTWKAVGPDNLLKCTVKVRNDKTIVETVLSPEAANQILGLVADIVAKAAAKNVSDFVMAVSPGMGPSAVIEGTDK